MSKVTVICTIYNTFPEVIGSMMCQTYQNWCLLLIHDGPNSTNLKQLVEAINDPRIKYIETPERKNDWGHPIRKMALENIDTLSPNTDYIVVTNADNHLVPHYLEYLVEGFVEGIIATFCSQFIHSYPSPQKLDIIENEQKVYPRNITWGVYKYGIIDTRLRLGYIDCACAMIKKEAAVESGWKDMSHSSDWTYFNRIIQKYGEHKWKMVRGCLVTHN